MHRCGSFGMEDTSPSRMKRTILTAGPDRIEARLRMQPAGKTACRFCIAYRLQMTPSYGVTVVANTSVGFDRSPEFVWTKNGRKVVNAVSNP